MSEPTPSPNSSEQSRSMPVWLAPAAWLVVLVLALIFFTQVSTVLLGVLAASIIACTLQPLMKIIPGPRGVDVAVLGLGLIAIVGLVMLSFSWPLKEPISRAIDNWPKTSKAIDDSLEKWSERLGVQVGAQNKPSVERLLENLWSFLVGQGGQQLFSRTADVLLGVLLSLAFTLIGSIFLLSDPPDVLLRPAMRLLAARHRPAMQAVLTDLASRYRAWVLGTLTGVAVVFVASSIGYSIIGLSMAIPLALLAGFAEIVPTVGPAVACVIAVLVAATQSGPAAAGVLVVYAIIQSIEAYVILPRIMRGAVNIHPAVTLFTVVLWGKIFGVAGLMLAIPINLTIWTLLEHFRVRPREREEAAMIHHGDHGKHGEMP